MYLQLIQVIWPKAVNFVKNLRHIIMINLMCITFETESLHELKDTISLSPQISYEQKLALIEKINSFNGFDCGYFTLGRNHLTSIVANFLTYIILLIQFKMAEKWWWIVSKLFLTLSLNKQKSMLKCTFKIWWVMKTTKWGKGKQEKGHQKCQLFFKVQNLHDYWQNCYFVVLCWVNLWSF